MENNFTPEQIEKAKAAKSPEELLSLAEENGVQLGAEQARVYFEKLNGRGEMSDDELTDVSGGHCGPPLPPNTVSSSHSCDKWVCKYCGKVKNSVARLHFDGLESVTRHCPDCKYSSYDNPRYLCNHPLGKD